MRILGRAPRYCAWVLRCREVPEAEAPAWRFSPKDPSTGERHGFASLAALVAFLHAELAGDEAPPDPGASAPEQSVAGHPPDGAERTRCGGPAERVPTAGTAPPRAGPGPATARPLALLGGMLVKDRTKVLIPSLVLPGGQEYYGWHRHHVYGELDGGARPAGPPLSKPHGHGRAPRWGAASVRPALAGSPGAASAPRRLAHSTIHDLFTIVG